MTIEHMIEVLNEALQLDPAAMSCLVESRVPCNNALAEHRSIQVLGKRSKDKLFCTVGLLGILNGMMEYGPERITAIYSDDGVLTCFKVGTFEVKDR